MTETAAGIEPGPDIARLRFAHHRAYLIGIDAYTKVSPLRTAVNDATRLAEVLAGQHRFEAPALLLDATGAQLRALLARMRDEVVADDRVLFYFAGHGIAADGDDGPAGYIVPADAEPSDPTSFVPMAELQATLDGLPCRHLLLVLDCCFSGAFKWSSQHRATSGLMPKRIYEERFERFVDDPARQIITSAAYDQKALDVLNGKATGDRGDVVAGNGRPHSPFALALFDALAGAADVKLDREGDGIITATEMYAYIRDQIEPATLKEGERLRQTPSFFPLKGHDKGEFMFLHPRHRLNLPRMPLHSPYKGLASFDEADRHLFYGRDRVIQELSAKAADPDQRLLVVVGASGTGKSSVIKAGLLPQLRKAGHAIIVMRPGAQPLAALEQALNESAGQAGAVLIVDQFEEIITRCAEPEQRQAFSTRLRELLDAGTRIARIVITVRSDFEPQLNGGALKEAWLTGRFTVPPFSLDELREVIVMPTIQEVLIFDPPELVDQIIGEVVQSPGVLPLLSYTLNELYEAYVRSGRSDRALRKTDYDALGGVMGALRTKADTLYQTLANDNERDTMRKIMLRMVSIEGDLAGRRVPMADLVYAEADKAAVQTVVERLIDARLIVRNADAIEPAHDALVRAWKTLRDWIHEAKDELILGEQIQIASRDYERTHDVEYLWPTNPNLPALNAFRKDTRRCWFNAKEVEFIRASLRLKTRRLRITIGIVAAVFVSVAGLMVWGWVEQGRATGTIAEARGFTDDLLVNSMKKLRLIERTQEVRKDLVAQVRRLHSRLVLVGAKEDNNTRFWTSVLEGDGELERGQIAAAQKKFEEAMRIAAPLQADPYWQRNLSIGHGQLGDLALKVGKEKAVEGQASGFDAARARYRQALEIDQALLARDRDNPIALNDLFVSYFRLGDLERRHAQAATPQEGEAFGKERQLAARRMYEPALALAERLANAQPDDAEAQRNLVKTLVELGNIAFTLAEQPKDDEWQQAQNRFTQALRWAEQRPAAVLHHESMKTLLGSSYGRLALLQSGVGQLDEARTAVRKALAIAPRARASDALSLDAEQQRDQLASLKTLGEIEARSRDFAAARLAYGEALQIAEREAGMKGADDSWKEERFALLLKLGEVEVDARQKKAARLAFQRASAAAPSPQGRQLASACAAVPRSPCEARN